MSCKGCCPPPCRAPSLPVVYLVPQPEQEKKSTALSCCCRCDDKPAASSDKKPARGSSAPASSNNGQATFENEVKILDEDYIRKHFNLPQRALYLDTMRRPLICFPMTQELKSDNFNMAKKSKINQQILDGFLDPSEAVSCPTPFPYPPSAGSGKASSEEEEETIYILQLPDWEYQCPTHCKPVRTPRYIWHSTATDKKAKQAKGAKDDDSCSEPGLKPGPGPLNKPKPWLLSRLTDFDFSSQW